MTERTAMFASRAGTTLGLLLAVWLTGTTAAAKQDWVSFRPHEGNGRICVQVGEDKRYYYPLESESPLEFTLRGPRRLRLITRHLPEDGKVGGRSYTIIVMRNDKEVLRKEIAAERSSSATLCESPAQAVGAAKRDYLAVPEGTNVFRVFVDAGSGPVAVRLFKDLKPQGPAYAPFVPEAYAEICTLVRPSGNEYEHYRAAWEKPVRFTVNGPTELVIRTRVDYDPASGNPGKVPYGVEILRNNEHQEVFYYKTNEATEGAYKERPGVLPGESKRIDLEVPKGKWTFELRPPQADSPTFVTRILIPEADIGPATNGVN